MISFMRWLICALVVMSGSSMESITVNVDGGDHNLSFAVGDDIIGLAADFAHRHNLGSPAADTLVNEMQRVLTDATRHCMCRLVFKHPLSGQTWLLPSVSVAVDLVVSGCGSLGDGETSVEPFQGDLGVQVTGVAGTVKPPRLNGAVFLEGRFDMLADQFGELTITFPDDKVEYGDFNVTLEATPAAKYDCGNGPLSGHAWFRFRPFTRGDQADTLTVEDLESRLAEKAQAPLQKPMRFAFASLLYTDDYLPGLLVLAMSLKKVESQHEFLALIPLSDREAHENGQQNGVPGAGLAVSPASVSALGRADVALVAVDWLDIGAGYALPGLGTGIWLKLHLWRLTQFDRVCYLDADTFVLRNIDELFVLSSASAVPFPSGALRSERFVSTDDYFPGAFFVLTPDDRDFGTMMSALADNGGDPVGQYVYGEQVCPPPPARAPLEPAAWKHCTPLAHPRNYGVTFF